MDPEDDGFWHRIKRVGALAAEPKLHPTWFCCDQSPHCEAPALTSECVLTRGERYIAAPAPASLPDAEADQLQAFELSVLKCSSASASLPGGCPCRSG